MSPTADPADRPAPREPVNEALWLVSRRGTFRVGPAPFTAPGAGEVVVEARAVAVNPVDAVPAVARRFVYPWLRHPTVLGTDVAGEVVAVGPGVSRFRVGDRVVGLATGQEKFRNDPAHGAFQRFVVLAADLTTPVPDAVALTDAVVLPLAVATAAAALFEPDQLGLALPPRHARPDAREPGSTVLVWGGSTSVGNNAVQLAAAAGHRVVATASPRNFALVRGLGAAEVVDYRAPTVVEEVVAALDGHPLAGTFAIGSGLAGRGRAHRATHRGQPPGGLRLPGPGHRRTPAARPSARRPRLRRLGRSAGGDGGRSGRVRRTSSPTRSPTGATGSRRPPRSSGTDLAAVPDALVRLRGGRLGPQARRQPRPSPTLR